MRNATELDEMITQAEIAIDSIRSDIARLDGLPFEQRYSLDSDIDRKFENLEQILNKMTSDLCTIPSQYTEYYDYKIKNFRSDFARYREELVAVTLEEAIRIGNEANAKAADILSTLSDDRRHLENIDNKP